MTSISGTASAGCGGAALILAFLLQGGSAAFAQERPSTASPAAPKDAPWTSPGLHQPAPDQPQPGEPQPVPPTGPPIVDPTRPEASAPAPGDSLSERLARSDGVLVPPNPEEGPGMQRTPPDPGPNTMPVLPPPDGSGDDRSVAPKSGEPK
ncbi:hypothetical protein [Oleisolibacter albus]|uniref:hypothetical protein n=1 Tax=Oleisolibacter albus TaxID=2171757 RepID=UPI0012D7483E|nr:hypothetical protein [Oleisolibacter albus]